MSLIPSTDVIQLTLTLKMTTEQVVETSVTVNNSPIQEYLHSDNYTQPTYGTHGLLMRMKSKIIKILFPPLVNCVVVTHLHNTFLTKAGLEITAGQRTMSGLIVDLTGQTFVLPVMLTSQNSIVLKMK